MPETERPAQTSRAPQAFYTHKIALGLFGAVVGLSTWAMATAETGAGTKAWTGVGLKPQLELLRWAQLNLESRAMQVCPGFGIFLYNRFFAKYKIHFQGFFKLDFLILN